MKRSPDCFSYETRGAVAIITFDLKGESVNTLAPEVAGCTSGGAFDRCHLFAQCLAARNQFQQLPVQIGQRVSQFIEIHEGKSPIGRPVLLAAHGYRKLDGAATILQ